MARGINKVILVGQSRPRIRDALHASGKAVTNFSIATSESWKDKQHGRSEQKSRRVAQHRHVRSPRGNRREYLRKGSQCTSRASCAPGSGRTKEAATATTTEIIANEMQMLGGRAGGGMGTSRGRTACRRGAGGAGQRPGAVVVARRVDDDIPF